MNNRSKSDYTYSVSPDGTLSIVDLNLGRMSVTNNAEGVLTELRNKIGDRITDMKIIYYGSEGQWDTIIPTWSNGECIGVEFKFGTE